MKIGKAVFRKNKIEEYDKNNFVATYKGRRIVVTTDHGFGESDKHGCKRFCMFVIHSESGMLEVDAWEDHETIEEAIKSALEGSLIMLY